MILRGLLSILLRPWLGRCEGINNIPKSKGAILCANHGSYLDHFIIGIHVHKATGKAPFFLAKKEHFESPWQRMWHRYLKAIPIDREAGGKDALAKAIEHLKSGDLIMIYPEGTRTLTGRMGRAKTGVARLALSAGVPVVPMGLTNTFHILPKGKYIPRLGKKSDLYIGRPLLFEKYAGRENEREVLRLVTDKVMLEIAHLAGTDYEHAKTDEQ